MNTSPVTNDPKEIIITNPADGTRVGSIPAGSKEDVQVAVGQAREGFSSWSGLDPLDRAKIFYKAAQEVRLDQHNLASLLTREQGKPLHESGNEISGFARVLEYYASVSGTIRGDYGKSNRYGHMIVTRQPIGVCAAIIPWNMPALIMGWKVGPILASGNSLVLKPSQTAPLTCLALAKHLYAAGLPTNVLQIVTGTGGIVGESLAKHPEIKSLSFTGSVATGTRVAETAAPSLKKITLELGGSDAMIICDDAEPDAAAKGAISGRFFNCGQTCTAIKRVFVDETIAGSFTRRVVERAKKLQVGNGLDKGTHIGPVHTTAQRDSIHEMVVQTIDAGQADVALGGEIPDDETLSRGSFYQPTILTGVDPTAPVMQEEVFGPVLPITTFSSLDDAIDMANSTRYGLGSSIWTHDMRTISRAIEEIRAGIIWVNQHLRIPPEVPFGGTKSSGIGRENGRYALEQYMEEKSILIGL